MYTLKINVIDICIDNSIYIGNLYKKINKIMLKKTSGIKY